MSEIKLGQLVRTKVEKVCFGTNRKEVIIPIGTEGVVCEVCSDHVEVEIWGDDAPEFVCGAYAYAIDDVEILKQYDFRFDSKLIHSFIGKTLTKYKHSKIMNTSSVTGILGFEINDSVFELTNDYESIDYFGLDNEATIFRIANSKWCDVESMINNDVNQNCINEKIQKILLVNDHTILKIDQHVEYDMWDTKAIIFYFENYELCFAKQDCWFSQEIEIYKGYNLWEKISDGKDILNDFDDNNSKSISFKRFFNEIV